MNLYLITFQSSLNRIESVYDCHKDLFVEIEKFFTLHLVPYTEAASIPADAYRMAFIASGGVEKMVTQHFELLPYPIHLLTDGQQNSLAASLEIATWIRSKGMKVHIIHGTIPNMVKQLIDHHKAFAAQREVRGKRIGVVGYSSPWLVASNVDYLLAKRRWGIEFIDIPMEEVYCLFYQIKDDDIGYEASVFANRAIACREGTPEDLLKAMRLYQAVKIICEKKKLDAVTLSCFSLIEKLGTTGCLALALLNDEGIPTPGQYFKSKHPDKKKFSNMSEKISWETVMVYNILKNLVYTGTLVSRKMKSCGVGSKKRVVNEPIIVEGTHEAIISKEDFELAQKVIRGGGRNPTRKQHDYPLKGLVRCGNCKRAMTRRKNKAGIRYFQCIHSVNNGNTDCPVGRSFPEMDIEKVVFHALTQFLALAQKEAIQNREVGDLRKSAIKECADKIRTLQKQNEQHKASKLRLYEKYAAGSITKEAYIQQKAAADVKIAENDGAIQRSHERMKELDSETACSDEKLDAVCEQYADCKALTYELTHAFISAVYIYDLDNIEIVWKFKDFLTTSEGEAK